MSKSIYENLKKKGLLTPPAFCTNAVATDMGWQNPITTEIVQPIPKLKSLIEEFGDTPKVEKKTSKKKSSKKEEKKEKQEDNDE